MRGDERALLHLWGVPGRICASADSWFQAQIFDDRLRARADLKFAVNIAQMFARGVETDAQPMGDFFVKPAFDETGQHLFLAVGKFLQTGCVAYLLKIIHYFPRNVGSHRRPAGHDLSQRLLNLVGVACLRSRNPLAPALNASKIRSLSPCSV